MMTLFERVWFDTGQVSLAPHSGGAAASRPKVRLAWDHVIRARTAYLRGDWPDVDSSLRQAFGAATEALLAFEGLAPAVECDMVMARRAAKAVFGEGLAEAVFLRAESLGSMLPLPRELNTEDASGVRASVAAASEYVALVESHVGP